MIRDKFMVMIMTAFCAVLLGGCGARDAVAVTFSQEAEAPAGQPQTLESGVQDAGMAQAAPEMVCVYLCGAVAAPGVYQLTEGSRLYEAVEMAGGLAQDADASCLNLARKLSDGEQIWILTCEETARLGEEGRYVPGQGYMGSAVSAQPGLVNINTATLAELTGISGIGEGRAQAIIAYREENGGFSCIEDIKKVDGIKEGLFSKIKDQITV